MFCNFICFIEQSTWNEILPLSKSVPKLPPISARPEFQAQVKRSSQLLKGKHLPQQERKFPHCWLRHTDKTRQDTADGAKRRVKLHLPLFKYDFCEQYPGPDYVVISESLENCFSNM